MFLIDCWLTIIFKCNCNLLKINLKKNTSSQTFSVMKRWVNICVGERSHLPFNNCAPVIMRSSMNASSSGTAAAIKLSLHLRWYDDAMIGLTEVWGGQLDSSEGLLIVNKKEKVEPRESRGKDGECDRKKYSMWGCRPLCPAGDYRWRSELNQNCADCQGMGSASRRVTQGRRGRPPQREQGLQPQFENRFQMSFWNI